MIIMKIYPNLYFTVIVDDIIRYNIHLYVVMRITKHTSTKFIS